MAHTRKEVPSVLTGSGVALTPDVTYVCVWPALGYFMKAPTCHELTEKMMRDVDDMKRALTGPADEDSKRAEDLVRRVYSNWDIGPAVHDYDDGCLVWTVYIGEAKLVKKIMDLCGEEDCDFSRLEEKYA